MGTMVCSRPGAEACRWRGLSLGPSEWASSLMSLTGPPENASRVPVTLESGKNQRSLGSFLGKCRPDHRGREDGVVSLFLPPP